MIQDIEQIKEKFLTQCKSRFQDNYSVLKNKKIYIYGSGMYGRFLRNALVKYGCVKKEAVLAYINDFENEFELDGVPVISYEKLRKPLDSDSCVVVGIENNEGVVNRLKKDNVFFHSDSFLQFWNSVTLMYNVYQCDEQHWITNYNQRIERFHKDLSLDEKLLCSFYTDAKSKEIVQSRLNFYNTGDLSYLENAPISKNEYFDSEYYSIGNNEIYVDVGSFNGDSVLGFARYTKNCFKKIYCFEPDPDNFAKLKKNVSQLENVELCPFAVGSENGEILFSGGVGEASGINEHGNIRVLVKKLDDLITEPVTFIKMDIEGFELAALKGATALIKKNRPKLAICVYHRVEDMLTIPQYIKSIVPEYHFKLRQHAPSLVETVLFAEI